MRLGLGVFRREVLVENVAPFVECDESGGAGLRFGELKERGDEGCRRSIAVGQRVSSSVQAFMCGARRARSYAVSLLRRDGPSNGGVTSTVNNHGDSGRRLLCPCSSRRLIRDYQPWAITQEWFHLEEAPPEDSREGTDALMSTALVHLPTDPVDAVCPWTAKAVVRRALTCGD